MFRIIIKKDYIKFTTVKTETDFIFELLNILLIMSVIYVLIAVSLILALGFLVAFIWSVKNGQYEDEYSPSVRILFDDENNNQNEDKKD